MVLEEPTVQRTAPERDDLLRRPQREERARRAGREPRALAPCPPGREEPGTVEILPAPERRRLDRRHPEQLRLELEDEVVSGVEEPDRLERARPRVLEPAEHHERRREQAQRRDPRRIVRRQPQRVLEMHDGGLGLPAAQLRARELARDLPAIRTLRERPAQERRGDARIAPALRHRGRLAQRVHHPPLADRLGVQELARDHLGARTVLVEHACGGGVEERPLRGGHVLADRRPDERVHELEWRLGAQDDALGQLRVRRGRLVRAEVRQRRGPVHGDVGTEDRDRACQSQRSRAEPAEAPDDDGERGSRGGRLGVGDERRAEEGIAAGRPVACGREARIGRRPEDRPRELPDRLLAQRGRLQRDDLRRDGQGRQRGVVIGRPRGRHERDGQLVHPPCEVREEPQRRLVGPVEVVDEQEQRPA